jgi:hypothetical protein
VGKETRNLDTFHSADPFPFLAACSISCRRPASSKFQSTADQIRAANPLSFQQANNNLLPYQWKFYSMT